MIIGALSDRNPYALCGVDDSYGVFEIHLGGGARACRRNDSRLEGGWTRVDEHDRSTTPLH
jgi:hypothetical protein